MRTFRPGKNINIPIEFIDAEGNDVDLPNGISDLTDVSAKLTRNGGEPLTLGAAGITFTDPGAAGDSGDYSLRLEVATLEDDAGAVIGPTIDSDIFEIEYQAEYEPGMFVKGTKEAQVLAGPLTQRPRLV